jgi:hypothetical protein
LLRLEADLKTAKSRLNNEKTTLQSEFVALNTCDSNNHIEDQLNICVAAASQLSLNATDSSEAPTRMIQNSVQQYFSNEEQLLSSLDFIESEVRALEVKYRE